MPTRRRLRSVPQPSSLVTSYVSDPWDPFDDEPLDPHEFPTDLEFQASWPTGVFILAMLSTAERDPIPAGVLQGLRDLAARHLHGPLDALTQRVLAEDEPSIRALLPCSGGFTCSALALASVSSLPQVVKTTHASVMGFKAPRQVLASHESAMGRR